MSDNDSIPKDYLLNLANAIMSSINSEWTPDQLEEDDLFSDEFYLIVVSILVRENSFNISPGETIEEKVNSLDQLIKFLATLVDMDLGHVNAEAIIFQRDEECVRHLLELIYELINVIRQEQEEMAGESEGPHTVDRSNNTDIQPSSLKEDESREINNMIPSHNQSLNLLDADHNTRGYNERSEAKIQTLQESYKEEYPNPNEQEELNNDFSVNFVNNHSCPEAEFEAESNNSQNNFRNNYSQNDLTRYEKVMAYIANNEEFIKQEEGQSNSPIKNIEYDLVNNEDVSKSINISRISEVSRSKENSEPHSNQKYLKKLENTSKNNRNESETGTLKTNENNQKHTNPSIYEGSKISSGSNDKNIQYEEIENDEDKEYEESMEGYDRNIESQSHSSYIRSNDLPRENSENTSDVRLNTNTKSLQGKKKSITNSSKSNLAKSKALNREEDRVLKKIKSQKQLINQENKGISNNKKQNQNRTMSKHSRSEISMSSVPDQSDSNINLANKSKRVSEITENIIEELPLNDENFKAEIIKEFRRLYGNKLDKVLLKHNLQNSHNLFDLIIRNIRLARQKMMRLGERIPDPEDIITKEFMVKYQKELQYIVHYYHNEERKRNFLRNKAVGSISKNIDAMRKIQEIHTRNIDSEIERRKKCREIKNQHNQVKFCNEIYSKALELEKQKYLEDIALQAEIRRCENEEKRKIMSEIEKYYKDKISILREILKQEKFEREIEHRAKIQFLSQLEREKKSRFKRSVDEIFNQLDEEDRKSELFNNSEQVEKIFNNYYRK